MVYMRITGRAVLNTHSLNAYGGAGSNYIEITKVKIVAKDANGWALLEVPAVSGNMLKHWHFAAFVDEFRNTQYGKNLTERALRYNATRFSQHDYNKGIKKADGTIVKEPDDEDTIIKNFADADLHGFLLPIKGGSSIRRVSLVKTAFMVPTEDFLQQIGYERIIYPVKHNRVDIDEKGLIQSKEEEGAMMIWDREYASGVYGFQVILDLGLVGKPQHNPTESVIPQDEEYERKKAAIKGLEQLLGGYMGANLARSFPISRIEEAIIVLSNDPLPALVHGFYKDYKAVNKKMLEKLDEKKAMVLTYGIKEKLVPSAVELGSINELGDIADEWMSKQ